MRSYTPTATPIMLPLSKRLLADTRPPQARESPVSAPFSLNQLTEGTTPIAQPSRKPNDSGTEIP